MTSESFTITTSDGTKLAGRTLGSSSAPCLFFSHSLGCTSAMWDDQVRALQDHFLIVLCDTRGHGDSTAPGGAYSLSRLSLDVLETLDALDVKKAHFCGLSLGGMIGQVLAVRAPARFESFILAATSPYMGPPLNWQSRIELVAAQGMSVLVEKVKATWFSGEGFATQDKVDAATQWLVGTDPVGYSGCCAAIRDMDLRGSLSANQTETLILAGEHDVATPPEHSETIAADMPKSQVVRLPGSHLLNLEQPVAFSKVLTDFYERLGVIQGASI